MNCELCGTAVPGAETRCRGCGFDTNLPTEVRRFITSLSGFRPGELLEGRYRIERILGFGGMSVVYKAHDDVLGEDVAIKVINGCRAGDDVKLFTDIRRDIVTTRKLAHPDIVKVHDLHKADSCGFLTMEFVQGQDLASLIAERGKLEEAEVCRVAVQIAEALDYAHSNGVVHCDIKPGNILLTATGRVKIADFGISRVMQEESTGLTGLVVGTPAYMSPEQIRGERPTPLTDMYALGIVMWHCLMGAPPYTRGDIAYQHVHVPLPPLDGVSPELERIVRKAAGKTMPERYASLNAMAQELRQLQHRQADTTIMQTPPPRPAATIMQTPAPRPLMQTPPPQQAATVMMTPPPRPVPVVMAPQPRQATASDGAPPPLVSRPAIPPPPPPDASAREVAAQSPPATGKPEGQGTTAKTRMTIAAIAVLFAVAALWALIPGSRRSAPEGGQNTPAGNPIPAVEGTAAGVGSAAPGAGATVAGAGSTAGRRPPATAAAPPPTAGKPLRRAVDETPTSQRQPEIRPVVAPATGIAPAAQRCGKAACFQFFDARITPSEAQPGQTVRCTARFTFQHNEGGTAPLEVEESVNLGTRSSRGTSLRIKAGQADNHFDVSFKVPARTAAGTYPVTLSVRRRSVTESVKLQLVVTK